MLVYFEGYPYPDKSVFDKILDSRTGRHVVPVVREGNGWKVEHIGYLFVAQAEESIPVFLLPKTFLQLDSANPNEGFTLLGMPGVKPESIYDTDAAGNILNARGQETFLPELSLWLFRAMSRYREDCIKEKIELTKDELDYRTPDHGSHDRDFLSTAIRLIDFLSDHRHLFTQIHKINNSGRAAVDWHKTLRQHPLIKDRKPYYLDLRIKDKAVNIDEELIVLYYSVLRYLKDKFHFPITIGEIPYILKSKSEIQNYLDTGVGKRRMRDMKGKYFRDDLLHLWSLLDAFFDLNISRDDKDPIKESLTTKDFNKVFERMVDFLIGDSDKLAALKNQKDGKLVDHIYLDKSLIGKKHSIYYIGDSKYYPDGTHPEGVALYKQFTYAKNAIQYNIDQFYLKNSQNPNDIRYRDKDTEGYNITPNFFVIPKIDGDTLDFTVPSFAPTDWRPKPNRHFKDRLFDRDTLLLREYSINMIFLIAAYGAYEDCWTGTLRETIRKDMVKLLNDTYKFFIIEPMDVPLYSQNGLVGTIPFLQYFRLLLEGKAYKANPDTKEIILAFEKDTPDGERDYREVRENIEGYVQGGSIETPITLEP